MIGIFLDRDGVINEDAEYVLRMEDVRFSPRSLDALALLNQVLPRDEARVIIVTNQSGLGRGMCTPQEFALFTGQYFEALRDQSGGRARIDDYLYCPHHPTAGVGEYRIDCACRKPKPGMLLEAKRRHGIDLQKSYLVGDRMRDIMAGQAAGCYSILVESGSGPAPEIDGDITPDAICADLYDATALILERVKNS
ncbi:MAG: HAD-IIIA family hydrolase [Verrucomicrobia bacterium]|nr:HAD-IIIA family hydrolase [Verrucomicrobiota bacterium]MDA1085815.1 HAD-IIIA family hydrolase [Verrucomicrobiota bacterium]